MKGKVNKEFERLKKEELSLLESQYESGSIEVLYGDESAVSESGYVPYAWQFWDENIAVPSAHGKSLNCFGLLSRQNQFHFVTSETTITSDFIMQYLDQFSLSLQKITVIVLDNARIHTAAKIKERYEIWRKRGLYIFYLPPYCPHLNIIERLWKELKARWIRPLDYLTADSLFYATKLALMDVGNSLKIAFKKYIFSVE